MNRNLELKYLRLMNANELRHLEVVQYLEPLREGGSMPGIVRADDDSLFVLKFRGAGQGTNALVAEQIGGLIADAIGLKVPELVFLDLDDSFSRLEPDEEIQDLLKFSVGLNLGMQFLSGAITYDPLVSSVDGFIASLVVMLDSLILNIDRTAKNTNMLNWNQELWLIDHGASLYFHHNWPSWQKYIERPFEMVSSHVLLSRADQLEQAASWMQENLTNQYIKEILAAIPTDWLQDKSGTMTEEECRGAYFDFLSWRLEHIDQLAKYAQDVR